MKMNLKKCATLAVIAGLGTFSAAGAAWAGSAWAAQGNCGWYALQSAKQQQINLQKGCNQTGSEWSKNVRAHKAYCESVSPTEWQKMLDTRQKALDKCK